MQTPLQATWSFVAAQISDFTDDGQTPAEAAGPWTLGSPGTSVCFAKNDILRLYFS